MDNKKRIQELLKSRKANAEKNPENLTLYAQRLLEVFPLDHSSNCEYFYLNTFEGKDEEDYLTCRGIFEGKNWNQVNLDILFTKHIEFIILNEEGVIYYLPTFLKYFYDLRLCDSEFFNFLMRKLAQGLSIPTSDQLKRAIDGAYYPATMSEYSAFERFNPIQSKLIAAFLINVANLLPSDSFDSKEAQRALTNYWGNFLLF